MNQPETFRTRCLVFSASILKIISDFPKTTAGRHVADQLLRCGTSVGAHVHEARGAESRADFIHKISIALKETRESFYWLALAKEAEFGSREKLAELVGEADQLAAIMAKSTYTARRNAE
jgi:four helix bundle protein